MAGVLGTLGLAACSSGTPRPARSASPATAASAPAPAGTTPVPPPPATVATTTGATATTVASPPAPECPAGQLRIGQGPPVSPETGEHAVSVTLTNEGRTACELFGYPEVSLLDANGSALPFRYTRGHSPYMTSNPPRRVVIGPGVTAWVLVAKYRCDVGGAASASVLRLYPPDAYGYLDLRIDTAYGVSGLDYCSGGSHDPGNTVGVSPVGAGSQDLTP